MGLVAVNMVCASVIEAGVALRAVLSRAAPAIVGVMAPVIRVNAIALTHTQGMIALAVLQWRMLRRARLHAQTNVSRVAMTISNVMTLAPRNVSTTARK